MKNYNKITNDVFTFLTYGNYLVKLKNLRKILAKAYYSTKEDKYIIEICPYKKESEDGLKGIPPTSLLHEIIHIVRPELTEKEVIEITKLIWEKISAIQRLILYEAIYEY